MDVTDIIKYVSISFIAGGAVALGLLKLLGKKWINNYFAKELEKYKQELELLKMQKQLQYSNIYIKRVDIITEMYAHLANINGFALGIKNIKSSNENLLNQAKKEFGDSFARFLLFYYKNNIYLTDSINTKINAIIESLGKSIFLSPELKEVYTDEYIAKLKDITEKNTPLIIQELIKEFRQILGIIE